MSRFGYSKSHLYKAAFRRRLYLMRRFLARRGSTQGTQAPASQDVYWVGKGESTSWFDTDNWSSSTGGAGGYGIPSTTNPVIFNGGSDGYNSCVLTGPISVASLTFTEAEATVDGEFSQNAKAITCGTLAYNCPLAVSDGAFNEAINLTGATFTITAAEDALAFDSDMALNCAASVTVASAVALAGRVTCAANFTTTAALSLGRLIMSTPGSTMTFSGGNDDFTLISYTSGDWDGDSGDDMVIVSDDSSTWDFVNPASMVVSYIDVEDSNATNAIDATDNCNDGTGNTNWTFV